MASDINIPGDELREAQNNLTFVHDFIDIGNNTFDFVAAFGPELGRGAAQNFENRWDDGQTQLKKQIVGVRDAIGSILDSFEQTDRDAAANLDAGQG
ncbi:hypothetical protein [Kineosporia babensis]|uniref:Uncharacterized protein n=1 Tax=Kineosporia babensis TaxID=499548 RepID=A0A9X1NIL3_9ACTN|nr:hypothetical protein [Kineosporia babensis]MCD5314735.1 hypothetical protein [Kineosporia babensis]